MTARKSESIRQYCKRIGFEIVGKLKYIGVTKYGKLWIDEAGNEFSRWVYVNGKVLPGLVKRREAERLQKMINYGAFGEMLNYAIVEIDDTCLSSFDYPEGVVSEIDMSVFLFKLDHTKFYYGETY